jgi:hypothetical protein
MHAAQSILSRARLSIARSIQKEARLVGGGTSTLKLSNCNDAADSNWAAIVHLTRVVILSENKASETKSVLAFGQRGCH